MRACHSGNRKVCFVHIMCWIARPCALPSPPGYNTTSPFPDRRRSENVQHLPPSLGDNKKGTQKYACRKSTLSDCELQVLSVADEHRTTVSFDSKGTVWSNFNNSPKKGPVSVIARANCDTGS